MDTCVHARQGCPAGRSRTGSRSQPDPVGPAAGQISSAGFGPAASSQGATPAASATRAMEQRALGAQDGEDRAGGAAGRAAQLPENAAAEVGIFSVSQQACEVRVTNTGSLEASTRWSGQAEPAIQPRAGQRPPGDFQAGLLPSAGGRGLAEHEARDPESPDEGSGSTDSARRQASNELAANCATKAPDSPLIGSVSASSVKPASTSRSAAARAAWNDDGPAEMKPASPSMCDERHAAQVLLVGLVALSPSAVRPQGASSLWCRSTPSAV